MPNDNLKPDLSTPPVAQEIEDKTQIILTLDPRSAGIVREAVNMFKDSLDMESPHGKYRHAFLLELRDTLDAAIVAESEGE